MNADIRIMKKEDYEGVHALWLSIKGFSIRSIDDSREGVEKFLKRNPDTSIVAEENGEIIGAILCGHDGRRATFYHVCVREDKRKQGIGKAMVVMAMNALKKEKINKVALIAFTKNDVGNAFWKSIGWKQRTDLNYYDFVLNAENIESFVTLENTGF
ncbi:MAG: GNAT family N-acetyltransferase [Lachnospiraceae bacterium]|nr:GNAT family N-acetyltransferase [Lachnospiraceae bacterium]